MARPPTEGARFDPALELCFERAFRSLACRICALGVQREVDALEDQAATLARDGLSRRQALESVYARARARVIRNLLSARGSPTNPTPSFRRRIEALSNVLEEAIPRRPSHGSPDFRCDAGLGGLARWLRAAGYDAAWRLNIDDDELLEQSFCRSAILLTTDGPLVKRGLIARGAIAALLVPNWLNKRDQFAWTAQKLDLPLRPARCMACGGELMPVDKQTVRDRIPPRTYPWLDDYFCCDRCGKLYWEGTHWTRIRACLEQTAHVRLNGQ